MDFPLIYVDFPKYTKCPNSSRFTNKLLWTKHDADNDDNNGDAHDDNHDENAANHANADDDHDKDANAANDPLKHFSHQRVSC